MDQAYLFNQGQDYMSYQLLGARPEIDQENRPGYRFAVWAPAASAVSVVGTFNDWDPSKAPLTVMGQTGIWTGFIAEAQEWDRYKYAIKDQAGAICLKADPFARHSETRPADASILYHPDDYHWQDQTWMDNRPSAVESGPLNIYEVHLGSWKRQADGSFMNYRDLAHELSDYISEMGYTAVELMPIMEHPLDASWGYQVTGYYSVTSRHGTPADFKYFVDVFHQKNIRVILDWVPAHFPRDAFGLARFDGTPLFEHPDTRRGEQQEWGTYVFDFGKHEVQSFLISNAWYWLDVFHIDGLRLDAVSSMLYLNYGRTDFLLNEQGGVENLDAVRFIQKLNALISDKKPACLMIAEEATPWPSVTQPQSENGLGFTHKWNMGWMHDSLEYMSRDYIYRHWHHHQMTFSMTYAFSERFILPLSHDEVVHGKKSLIDRMPGDYWQKFACLRTLFIWQMTHPGSKLTFMGNEFAQFVEWRFDESLEWFLLEYEAHQSFRTFVTALNHYYLETPALWQQENAWSGFCWLTADDAHNSVYVYERVSQSGKRVIVLLNETPQPHPGYQIPVRQAGRYQLLFNSDDQAYGGSGYLAADPREHACDDEAAGCCVCETSWSGETPVLTIDLPPLCGLILENTTS